MEATRARGQGPTRRDRHFSGASAASAAPANRNTVLAPSPRWPLLKLSSASPQGWSDADRALLLAGFVCVLTLGFGAALWYLLEEPAAWWLDRNFVRYRALPMQGIIAAVWLAIGAAALAWRGRSDRHRPLVQACVYLCFAESVYGSVIFGQFTSLYTGAVLIGVPTTLLLFFDRRSVLLGLGAFVLAMIVVSIAQQVGLLRYAPLLADSPIADGRLSNAWLAGIGTMTLLMLGVTLAVNWYVIERWRADQARLAQIGEQLARATTLLSRYVPGTVAERIRSGSHEISGRHERCRLTVFFSDIVGFSLFSDTAEPEDLSRLLNQYLSEMAIIAERYAGTIDKFVGDGIMIFFGAPVATTDEDQALRAVRMAIEMQQRLRGLREQWMREGVDHPFHVRMGINSGMASVGDWGSPDRTDYTAIGRQVTLAARLQQHAEPDHILMSHNTWVLVRDHVSCVAKGELQPKGSHQPVKVYEVVGEGIEGAQEGIEGPRDPGIKGGGEKKEFEGPDERGATN